MFTLDKYEGMQFFKRDELVDTSRLIQMGYQKATAVGLLDKSHQTDYFYHPNKPYVFIVCCWNKNTEDEYFTQIIVSKDIIEKMCKVFPRSVYISESTKNIDAMAYVGRKEHLVRAFLPKGITNYIMGYATSNIIDSKEIKYYSQEYKERELIYPKSVRKNVTVQKLEGQKVYTLCIIDKYPKNTNVLDMLREDDFRVRCYDANYIRMTQVFGTEEAAWKAVIKYEEKYYQELKDNPVKLYIGENFDIAYRYFMLEELSYGDVTRQMLFDKREDWFYIMRHNLMPLYEKYNIPFLGVSTDADGSLIPDISNSDEVKNFRL